MFNSVEQVEKFFAFHNPEDFGYDSETLIHGNKATCLGDGLVQYSLFTVHPEYGGYVRVGHVLYDNGTQAEKYGQSFEDWSNFKCMAIEYPIHALPEPEALYLSNGEFFDAVCEKTAEENKGYISHLHHLMSEEEEWL